MELGVQRNFNLNEIYAPILGVAISLISLQNKKKDFLDKREKMILEEGLHIGDKLSYDKLKQLYEVYGISLDIEEKDFALYFLDIDNYAGIQSGKNKETEILTREYISKEYMESIKEKLIANYNLKPLDTINYEMLLQMYNSDVRKISLKSFCEDILEISWHTVDKMKVNKSMPIKIFSGKNIDSEKIEQVKEFIINEAKIHIGDQITLTEFLDLYNECGNGLTQKDFAIYVLGASPNSYNRLKGNKTKTIGVFSTYVINPDDIYKLREKVILEEKLHIEEMISKERFLELYKKYSGIMPENMFAEEILDISPAALKYMNSDGKALILKNIQISDEYVNSVREIIIKENKIPESQINIEEFQRLFQKYGYILNESQFASLILDAPITSYNNLKNKTTEKMNIFVNRNIIDFKELRDRVIKENDLHYDDKINYFEFKRLYDIYAGDLSEVEFAEKVLDILPKKLNNLRFNREKGHNTSILLNESLPSDKEIEDLKRKVLQENKLHIKDKIDYKKFQKLHKKYGGILPEYIFAEKILDIRSKNLPTLKNGGELQILLKTQMSEEEIQELRNKAWQELFFNKSEITLSEFEYLYNNYNHILPEIAFAKDVLGINFYSLDKLRRKINKTSKVNILIKENLDIRKPNINDETKSDLQNVSITSNDLMETNKSDKDTGESSKDKGESSKDKEESDKDEKESTKDIKGKKIRNSNLNVKKNLRTNSLSKEDKEKEEEEEKAKRRAELRAKADKLKARKERKRERDLASAKRTQQREEEKLQKEEKKEEKKLNAFLEKETPTLKAKVNKIIKTGISNDTSRYVLKCYINESRREFDRGKFKIENLDLLEQSMQFIECGERDIALFAKMCIAFDEYKRGDNFISHNINNEGITSDSKFKLRKLQENIRYAIKKEKAIQMLQDGAKNLEYVSNMTGVRISDVIRLARMLIMPNHNGKNKNDNDDDARRA